MMRSSRLLAPAALTALAALGAAQSFSGIGFRPGGDVSLAYGVSADGFTVVGGSNGPTPYQAIRRTPAGVTSLGTLQTGGSSDGRGISADGSVAVGIATSPTGTSQAFRHTAAGGIVGLGDLPGGSFFSEAHGVSGDGAVTVGNGLGANPNGTNRREAFRHTVAGGMTGLGFLSTVGQSSQAFAASFDGSVVVGDSISSNAVGFGTEAFRWTAAGGMVGLGDIAGGPFASTARGVSADGRVIVGYGTYGSSSTTMNIEAFRWTAETGLVGISDLPGGSFSSRANGVSPDGRFIVGVGQNATDSAAFLWSEPDGMVELRVLLETIGLGPQIQGWDLREATGVTTNAAGFPVIVGRGVDPQGRPQGFIATVPEPGTMLALGLGGLALLRRRRK